MFQLFTASQLKQKPSGSAAPLVIDARRRYEFNAGHIPGAICMRWEQWCQPAPESASSTMRQPGWWGKLAQPNEENFGQRLGLAGIGHDQPIVVYADSARSKGRDARIAWMLLYLGAKTVALLDGGWQGWLESKGEIQVDIEAPPASTFVVSIDCNRRLSLDNILSASEKRALIGIDTRTQEEHRGQIYDYQPRKGKIPNTVNIPFFSLYDGTDLQDLAWSQSRFHIL